jgi:hypothetical protein
MQVIQLPKLIVLTVSLLLSGCYSKAAIRPPDILDKSSGRSIVLLSTSAAVESHAFAKGIIISKVGDDGKRSPVTAYSLDNPWEATDIPQEHIKLRWLALDPGAYVIEMGLANPYFCVFEAPEFHFTLDASQRVYLGEFRAGAARFDVSDHMDRDVAYFHSHATGGSETIFTPLPMQVEHVDNTDACKKRAGPAIAVSLPHR